MPPERVVTNFQKQAVPNFKQELLSDCGFLYYGELRLKRRNPVAGIMNDQINHVPSAAIPSQATLHRADCPSSTALYFCRSDATAAAEPIFGTSIVTSHQPPADPTSHVYPRPVPYSSDAH
ncbi:hypothetical protein VTN96DRAFT_1286 [Rasamsonia emersonii]